MSSNFKVTRVCIHCGNDFQACTTVTKYCSLKCSKAYYKAKIRDSKKSESDREVKALKEKVKDVVKSKEFLTVKDVAFIMGCGTSTVYDMINAGRLKATNLSIRNIRVTRTDLDKLFMNPGLKVQPKPKKIIIEVPLTLENCYSIPEIIDKFDVTRGAIYALVKRRRLPKLSLGKCVYISKKEIDKLLRIANKGLRTYNGQV